MTALIEFVEMKKTFGVVTRIRKSINFPTCGKNRRNARSKALAKKTFPKLTFNRVISFSKVEGK